MIIIKIEYLNYNKKKKKKEDCPKDENGEYDYETIDALKVDLLNQHLKELTEGKEIESPIFDFVTGKPKQKGIKLKMKKDSILILEGIHCLNEKVADSIDKNNKFRIFVSAFSQMNVDEKQCVSNVTNRLIRRILRDHLHRNIHAGETLHRIKNVRKGELKFIFPYLDNSDFIFNSSLDFEFSILKGINFFFFFILKVNNFYFLF
jgi:uridine kinase